MHQQGVRRVLTDTPPLFESQLRPSQTIPQRFGWRTPRLCHGVLVRGHMRCPSRVGGPSPAESDSVTISSLRRIWNGMGDSRSFLCPLGTSKFDNGLLSAASGQAFVSSNEFCHACPCLRHAVRLMLFFIAPCLLQVYLLPNPLWELSPQRSKGVAPFSLCIDA